ncbi:ABC transporter substrate-binding protein [Spongiactinospora gelatinilytica]|uniref:ABC transporter substrate-binding protein n=1 Tax=Spongiactinospora gelatinilytica TaxID=2666298 RepID=A0A2W2GA15_9ACTN|nr:glutamate ABC transporter substrate-binding protein [Spongiactinospora gelatinilytica]PZG37105.1 ABC transporter substrate-binding protein [Spongiactinospora gelatinilytica]
MRVRHAVIAAALVLGVSGCGLAGAQTSTIVGKETMIVGVKIDQPGLGALKKGRNEGFDVDVAAYLARKLGAKNVVYKETKSAEREEMLRQGKIDFIVASYSITAERKVKVDFAGPYYVAHQDTLVRASDTGIDDVRDLAGKKLCQVTGSNSWRRVKEERKVNVSLVEMPSYRECTAKLADGSVDAVSTDDLILAGLAGETGTSSVRFVNAPFTDERYGVGLKKGDVAACEAINRAISEMYLDGTAKELLGKWFGRTGLKLTVTVPQFEGC